MIQDEMDGESCAARLCEFAARRSRESQESLGKDGPMAASVNGSPENGGGAGDLSAVGLGSRAIVGDLESEVARAPGDGVKQGGINFDGSTGRDRRQADKQAPEPVARRAVRDVPPGVGPGGRNTGRPRPPPAGVTGPEGGPAVSEQGSEGGTGRGPPGGNRPEPMRFGKVGPGCDDGGGRSDDGTPAGKMLAAARTAVGLQ